MRLIKESLAGFVEAVGVGGCFGLIESPGVEVDDEVGVLGGPARARADADIVAVLLSRVSVAHDDLESPGE